MPHWTQPGSASRRSVDVRQDCADGRSENNAADVVGGDCLPSCLNDGFLVSLIYYPSQGLCSLLIVPMGMPALLYQFYFCSHGIRSLKRNVLGMVGIGRIRSVFIGSVETCDASTREGWLRVVRTLG